MNVVLVGSGPGIESVAATLSDVDVQVTRGSVEDVETAELAVVSGLAGSQGFRQANEQSLAGGTLWIALEIGGIGGHAVEGLDAAVTTLQPAHVCFDCLATRVEAGGVDDEAEASADRAAVRLAGSYAGLLAIRILSGEATSGIVIEVPHAERTLLPVPNCTCEDESDGTLDLHEDPRSLEAAIASAEVAVDRRLGIIREIGEHDSFPAPYYLSVLAATTGFSDASAPGQAAGVAIDWDSAFMKALGESLERYSAAIYREASFGRAPIEDVDGPSPAEFVRPEDYPDPDPDEDIAWVPGWDLIEDREVSLPAGRVHFPSPDTRFGPAITTGLGLGSGGVEAVRSGLYEVIERDATMLAWYSTFEPLELTVDSEAFETLVARARSEGLSVAPVLVTQDVDVPVVTVAVHREEWPRFAVGSAADLDAAGAAVGALSEALQNWMELDATGPDGAADAEGAIGRYAADPGEAERLLQPSGRVEASAVGPTEIPDGRAELDVILDRAGAAGLSVYAADITPRDVAQLEFAAVRVLSPEAQPLFVGDPFFGQRARTVPVDLGFEPQLDREFHPYP